MNDLAMSITEKLLAELRAAYPNLTFDTQQKSDSAHADDDRYACTLIGVVAQDVLIVDPFASSCGRFSVDPEEAYGLPEAAAKQLFAHNCTPAPTNPTPAP